ncbi:MAG: M6 family metalloprotease domain-containing protein [Bacteroidales bacterium]|nr:M6 family metalloprotease domain-containing protein [Bacteroidales bacterium]
MKRIVTLIFAALLSAVSFNATATIAYPYPVKVTQPDGSVITLQIHGDEFHHWITSEGKVMELNADGFYRPATGHAALQSLSTSRMTRENAAPQAVSSAINRGENLHFLVVLVQFDDLKFTVDSPNEAFSELLNGADYKANGGTGSVKEYFVENSNNVFKPVFDVVGPVTVSERYSYYGSNADGDDAHAALAFWEACQRIKDDVNFEDYDLDNNGVVDNIFFYYAGHNEAELAGADYIWPHKWDFSTAKRADTSIGNLSIDGKTLGTYACTSELKGKSGTVMCGIGTFCHEFSHVLGLPDFYDTDYESNGSAAYAMGPFSLMSEGNYNNDGRTPPALTAVEREILGWMAEIPEWTQAGVKTVPDIMSNQAFKTGTNIDGEYFVYETRGGSDWDAPLGAKGLLIYHVDRSSNRVSGLTTAASLWNSGKINAYGAHPCCQPMPACGSFKSTGRIVYPGADNVTAFNVGSPSPMVDWSGNQTGRSVTDIRYANDEVTLTFGLETGKTVSGTVKDENGKPVIGASVVLAPVTSSKAMVKTSGLGMQMSSVEFAKAPSGDDYIATIGSDGTFSFDLSGNTAVEYTLTVSCHGYMDYASSFRLTVGTIERDIVLHKIEVLSEVTEYQKFDWKSTSGYRFTQPVVVAARYTTEELTGAIGSKITSVGFALSAQTYNEIRIVVDFGDETVLDIPVTKYTPNKYQREDVSAYDLVVPSDKDVYIGVHIDTDETGYPYLFNSEAADRDGLYYRLLHSHAWTDLSDEGSLTVSFVVEPQYTQPYAYGFNGIANPKAGKYAAGDSFEFRIVESAMVPDSVDWFYDGAAVKGSTMKVTAGEHVVKAVLHFSSGRTETIEQIIIGE